MRTVASRRVATTTASILPTFMVRCESGAPTPGFAGGIRITAGVIRAFHPEVRPIVISARMVREVEEAATTENARAAKRFNA